MAGKPVNFVEANVMVNESPGTFVSPESLYEAQLALRLGGAPEWVAVLKTEWELHRKSPLPSHSSRGRWLAEDKASQYGETVDLGRLIGDVSLWFGSFEKTPPVYVSVPEIAIEVRTDWTLLHTLLQNIVFSLVPAGKIQVEVSAPGAGILEMSLRREDAALESKAEKAIKGAELDSADAWTEAMSLASFMGVALERNARGNEVRLRMAGL
jgi:hypothetical protein